MDRNYSDKLVLLIVALVYFVNPVLAQDKDAAHSGIVPLADYSGDLLSRGFLSGDWGGARSSLAEKGVQIQLDTTQTFQSITEGGRATGNDYGASFDNFLQFDLHRMGVLPGAVIAMRGESRLGNSVDGDTGTIMPSNTDQFFPLTAPSGENLDYVITELTYTQFLSKQFAIYAGKLNTLGGDANEFASGRGKTQFQNSNFIFNPVSALTVPYSTLGTGVLWAPTDKLTIVASVFNTSDASTSSGFSGFGDGWTAGLEVQSKHKIANLPGGQNIGMTYAGDGDYNNINGKFSFAPGEGLAIGKEDSSWAAYWSGWQYIWSDEAQTKSVDVNNGVADLTGLGLFGRAGFGDDDTLPINWAFSGGIGGKGLIPCRENDQLGIGYFYGDLNSGRFTERAGIEDAAQGVEAFYNIFLTKATNLTLDVQFLDSLRSSVKDPTILGGRLNINF